MRSKQEIARSITEDVFGKGRVDLVDEYFTEDFVNHDPQEGFGGGREALREVVEAIRAGLSDIRAEATHILVDGEYVAVRWVVDAVHTAELFGAPPTNNRATVDGISIYRFEDGRVAEEWARMNDVAFMKAVGMIPQEA